jgi:chromosomal replication initiation ATPase DnaA
MLKYTDAKNAFRDEIRVDDYIELEGSQMAYEQLAKSLDRPLKMALLFGKPGTGKTLLLHRLYNNFKYQKDGKYFCRTACLDDERTFLYPSNKTF